MHNRGKTKRLITASVGFLEAAMAIAAYERMFHWPAFYVNLSYAVELSLKAFLASRGETNHQLIQISHNLSRARQRALELGYVEPDDQFAMLIEQIDGKHGELRYLEGEEIELADVTQALAIVEAHVRAIGLQIPVTALNEAD